MDAIALAGRILLTAIFLESGFNKLLGASSAIATMERYSLPMPTLAYAVAVVVEIGGGLLVLFGLKARWAAAVLAAWCIATALIAHLHPDDSNQMIHFMKNVAMAGGFLQIVAFGPGRLSLDRR